MNQEKILIKKTDENLIFSNDHIKIKYNTQTGLAEYFWKNKKILSGVYSVFKLNEDRLVKNYNYEKHVFLECKREELRDGFGKGVKLTIENSSHDLPTIYYKISTFMKTNLSLY